MNIGDGTYRKNYEDIFDMVSQNHGLTTAIKHAKRRMSSFNNQIQKPSEYDPGTTVYELVEELKKYLVE